MPKKSSEETVEAKEKPKSGALELKEGELGKAQGGKLNFKVSRQDKSTPL